MSELTHLSYSSISSFLMCPRAWRYHYIDKIKTPTSPALVFGSAFHHALEEHITKFSTPGVYARRTLADDWREKWAQHVEAQPEIAWDKEPDHYQALGTAMLSVPETVELVEHLLPLTTDRLMIEERVELRVPGVPVPVIGYIDIIEHDGVPADFKTSSRAWSAGRAHEELQPTFYLAALNQMGFELNPEQAFKYYVFVKNAKSPRVQIHETHRTAGEMFWLFGLIREVWEAIQSGAFPPNPTTWKHSPKWCQFWSECMGGTG